MPLVDQATLVAQLSPPLDPTLTELLVKEFISLERRYIQRDWEPAQLDGGQFCEVLGRIIYHQDSGNLNLTNRSPEALGPAYEHPDQVSDDIIETYLRPLVRNEQRTRDFQRFLAAFDNNHTRAIESRLKKLRSPTLIVWGTDDVYFDVKWSHWLAGTIPGTRRRVEFRGARIFFPEERWADFNRELRLHWAAQ